MGELMLIAVVLALGALAYWLFGDVDRWERISSKAGPKEPLLMILLSLYGAVQSLHERHFIWAGVSFLLLTAFVGLFIKGRFPPAS